MITEVNIKFCLLNAENLFLLFDEPLPKNFEKLEEAQWQALSTSVYENKPLFKTKHLAETLLSTQADIIMLCEVGGLESLKNFNEYFLKSQYSPILIEGNSDRHIDVGFLIKKNHPFYFDLLTHKNRDLNFLYPHEKRSLTTNYPVKIQSHKFSRDCAELRLFRNDVNKPFLIVLLTHLKSPLDPERIDPNGTERRAAELKTCVEIIKELESQFPQTPLIFCGDFNGYAHPKNHPSEFSPLFSETNLVDVFELSQISEEQRATFIQVRNGSRAEGRQIDFCFLNQLAIPYLNKSATQVLDYKDEYGSALKKPENLEQKLALPSDHYPIIFNLEKVKI